MGKGRDRERRKRGYDDDNEYSPPPSYQSQSYQSRPQQAANPAPSGPTIDAVVKWYNAEKGFGFVELSDGSGDVFLHVSALQATGHETVSPGAKMRVQVGQGAKGRQVTGIAEVQDGPATEYPDRNPPRDRPQRASSRDDIPTGAPITVEGSVKWFTTEKGFGFVGADDGLRDVFIHISVVEKGGLSQLTEGQRVTLQVVATQKGREAISVAQLT